MGCRWSITNHAEDAILTDSKGKTYTNFCAEETLILGDDAVLKVGNHKWSLEDHWERSLKARNSYSINHCAELTTANSCSSLGKHMVHFYDSARLLEMSVPNEDTEDYGNIEQFGINQCMSSLKRMRQCSEPCLRPKDFVIFNRSDHVVVIFVDHCFDDNVFKLLPGQRTKYRGAYACRDDYALTSDGTWSPKAVRARKNNPKEYTYDNNPGYLVHVSNKTLDAITCRTDKGNVIIPSRSFLECFYVAAMFTLEGNQLPPFKERSLVELDLDGYHFVLDTTKYPTKVTITQTI